MEEPVIPCSCLMRTGLSCFEKALSSFAKNLGRQKFASASASPAIGYRVKRAALSSRDL